MALPTASDNLFPKLIVRESADDGSDFSNPSADYRVLFVGEDGDLHLKDSAGTVTDFPAGGGSGGGVSYFSRRLLAVVANAAETCNVNSTAYVAPPPLSFYHDWDFFQATHFLITAHGLANAAANTITCQLAPFASPTNPVSSGGDDLVITNTEGAFSSGWIAVSDAMSGLTHMAVAVKGSNATVDLSVRMLDIAFKIEP